MNENIDDLLAAEAVKIYPGSRVVEVRRLAADADTSDETHKSAGYGVPRRIRLRAADGSERSLVFHVAATDSFGHDRRADRAAEQLLAFDSFHEIPRHVRAVDVGAVSNAGLISLRNASEFYLVTEGADGTPYADDLRRIAHERRLGPNDMERAGALARYLVELHRRRGGRALQYRRSVRDLVGSGEGIFGRHFDARATTIHGDFHPFNVVFSAGLDFTLLDASRGCLGDASDDVTAMAINYLFFALDHDGAWEGALRMLWHHLWRTYLDESGDAQLFANDRFDPALADEVAR